MKSKTVTGISCLLIIVFLLMLIPVPAQAASAWYDESWAYRKKITIDHTQVPGNLTSFPVVINEIDPDLKDTLNSGRVGQSDAGDIVFTAGDGTTKLAHEIEKYTPGTGELVAWVKVPLLSSTLDTDIYIYYGNAACPDQWDISGTWASEYKMVQHFKESSGNFYDSSQFSNDGTPQGGVIQGVTGKIDGAAGFDGLDDFVASDNATSLNITDGITIEALVKGTGDNFTSDNQTNTGRLNYSPQFQVVGTSIYFIWYDWAGDEKTWTGKMNTDGTGWAATERTTGIHIENPQLQVVGSKIYSVWIQTDNSTKFQIWTGEMNTDGTGWAATQRTTTGLLKYSPQLQVVGDQIYYVWVEWNSDVLSDWQIWTARMNTDGTGWAAARKTTLPTYRYSPQFQVVGDKIYFVWNQYDSNYQIWTAVMDTDGSNWAETPRTNSGANKGVPQLQVVGSRIYYLWQESTGGNLQIWTGQMDTDGSDWAATQRTTSAYDKEFPQFQVVGNKVYFVWHERDGVPTQIWTGEMNTDGSGWTATQRTVGSNRNESAQLQVVGSKIYFVWEQNDNSYDYQIWTGQMGSNILNKGDFYGVGMIGNTVRGFINAGVDGFKYKAEAISDTAGAIMDYTLDAGWNANDWNHIALTYDQSALKLYINGNLAGSTAYSQAINTNDFDLIVGDDFDGLIDEAHIINTARSGDWKKTCANNEIAAAAFFSVGSEETPDPDPPLKGVGGEVKPVDKLSLVIPWLISGLGIITLWMLIRIVRRRVS